MARLGERSVRLLAALALVAPLALAAGAASAQDKGWIGTWSASPQPVWSPDFFAPVAIPRSVRDQTIRQVARVSQGGDRLRVEFSNRYGDEAMTIGRAAIAPAGKDGAIAAGSSKPLTFAGATSITIPAGAPVWSDPVDLAVADLSEVAVTIYLPSVTPLTTWHNDGRQTAMISDHGDFTDAATFTAATTTNSRLFLSGIDVAMPAGRSVVLFGDSITDGDSSTPNANHRWPDVLAERIVKAGADVGVLNEGISGARILRDRMGDNALARFQDDVLAHPNADTVVLMMGINDIGWPDSPLVPAGEPAPTADDIIAGYRQLVARAHMAGVRIIGATLTPFENTFAGGPLSSYYNADKEAKRVAVNDFIRNGGAFDGVIDFDAVMRNPADPKKIRAEFDSGDHLHPNDAGYAAMANAVDLSLLGIGK